METIKVHHDSILKPFDKIGTIIGVAEMKFMNIKLKIVCNLLILK
jgi:hypothetical protein